MKQYTQLLPIYLRMLLLLVLGQLSLTAVGQDLSDSRWYFGNSQEWLSFQTGRVVLSTGQVTPYGSAGSVVGTDYRTGELLFYSDGSQLIGANNNVVRSGLPGDPTLPQPVHAIPIPGQTNSFYLFFLTSSGNLLYARYDVETETLGTIQPLNIGGQASGVMEVIRASSNDNWVYWLVVPLEGTDARFTLVRVEDTAPQPTPTTLTAATGLGGFDPASMAFHYRNGLLAVGNSASADLPVMLFNFDLDASLPDATRITDAGTLPTVSSGGGAISGLSWILNFLYVSKEQNASGGTNGNLYRYDLTDYANGTPPTLVTVGNASAYRNFGLRTSSNNQVYHLFQLSTGGPIQVGRINGYSAASPALAQDVFGTTNFRGTQFSRSAFPSFVPVTIDFDYSGGCAQSPTYFYPIFTDQGPTSVDWFVNDVRESQELQPYFIFEEPGVYNIKMRAYYPGSIKEITKTITIDAGLQLTIQPEYIICPDATETITLQIQDDQGNDVTDSYTSNITWYKPQSVREVGKETIESGVKEIEVAALMSQRLPDGSYPEAGTYYVVVNTGQCELYAAFEVVVYNNEFFKFNTWYFGNGAGINFNEQPAVATPAGENQMTGLATDAALEGTTISADANSDVLFYTNGETLWTRDADGDGTHERAPNGDNLGGSRTAAQNSLLIPHPADPSLHYLFTISDEGERALRYTVADLKGNDMTNPLPDVELARSSGQYVKGRLLYANIAEKLAGTSNNDSGWIIAHELGNNRFISYPIKVEGIGSPTFSQAGSIINEPQSPGYMALAPNDSLLAMAVPNANGGNLVEIFRFDPDNGTVQDGGYVRINVPAEGGASIYGLAFSPNSKRIWVTTTGSTSYLYQMSLDSALTQSKIQASLVEVAEVQEELGAIQLAPDNFLYVARNGASNVGSIQNPDDSLRADNVAGIFELEGIQGGLNGQSLLGLPNLIHPAGRSVMDPSVFATSACQTTVGQDQEVILYGSRRYNNEQVVFKIYDMANPGTQLGADIRPEQGIDSATVSLPPGNYRVVLQLEACDLVYPTDYPDEEVVEAFFSIFPKPSANIRNDDPSGEDVAICEQQGVTLQGEAQLNGQPGNPSDFIFTWFNDLSGEQLGTGPTQLVTEAGVYRLEAISLLTGCPAEPAFINVVDARPEADLGDDFGACAGEPLPVNELSIDLDVPSNYTIKWLRSVNANPFTDLQNNSLSQTLSDLNTAQGGTYRYLVEVRHVDPSITCYRADTVTITIGAAPLVQIRPTNNTCNGSTDLVAEVQDGSGNYSYQFFRDATAIGSGNGGIITVFQSGTYSVEVTDALTGCTATSQAVTVDVQNGLQDLTVEAVPGCRSEGVEVLNELTAVTSYTGEVTFEWYRLQNGTPEAQPFTTGQTIAVPNGSYRVVATTPNPACSNGSSADATVQSVETPAATLEPRYTLCPSIPELRQVTLELPGYTNIRWYNRATGQLLSRDNTFVVTAEGEYEVQVEGCAEPVPFQVLLDCSAQVYLPNVIRPGGTNNEFSIINTDMIANLENFEILIYNRWGEVIFQSTDPAFVWRGLGPDGKTVPMSNYAYLIRYRNRFGENRELRKIYGSIFVMY